LCDNALKFTLEGKVSLSADVVDHYVVIQVSDTGIGFDIEADLVKPFHRLHPDTYYGLGLGLNMVNDIVAKLCGKIEFDSQKGNGTTVKVWLPVSSSVKDPKIVSESLPASSTASAPGPNGSDSVAPVATENPDNLAPVEQNTLPLSADGQERPRQLKAQVSAQTIPPFPAGPPAHIGNPTEHASHSDIERCNNWLKSNTFSPGSHRPVIEVDKGIDQRSHAIDIEQMNEEIEILKQRIFHAQSLSNHIRTLIKSLDDRHRY
jgi:hypothetical protein